MRRLRRRRPAGEPQVPIEVVEPFAVAPVVGPTVVRIGPDRTLLDAPWEVLGCSVANVWPDDRVPGGWARVEWPRDDWSQRPIVPLDLHIGHVLEFRRQQLASPIVFHGVVAAIDHERVILARAASATAAASIAKQAVDVWRASELAAKQSEWLERMRCFCGPNNCEWPE